MIHRFRTNTEYGGEKLHGGYSFMTVFESVKDTVEIQDLIIQERNKTEFPTEKQNKVDVIISQLGIEISSQKRQTPSSEVCTSV